MKIPFDIKFRPQIESGEYKVVTAKEQSVRIICWDRSTTYWKIVALVLAPDGKTENPFTYDINGNESDGCLHNHEFDLFIITPEPELSEFEKEYMRIVHKMKPEDFNDEGLKIAKEEAAELLNIARKELCEQVVDHTKEAYENGKADALKDLPKWRYKKGGTGPILHDCLVLNKYGCIGKSPSGALLGNVWILEYDELAKLPKEDNHE